MKKNYVLASLLACTVSVFAQSVENYDDNALGTVATANVFVLDGLKYTITGSSTYSTNIENKSSFSPLGNSGTDHFILFDKGGEFNLSSVKIEKNDGSLFTLGSFSFDGLANSNISVTTNKTGAGLTYASDGIYITNQNINLVGNSYFQNITSVTISGGNLALTLDDLNFLAVLPVTLIGAHLNIANNNNVNLNWSTASESENAYFEILHSLDGKTFALLDKIAGKAGNENKYAYTYKNESAGTHYFQLAQVDNDGTRHVLTTKSIKLGFGNNSQMVSPNPIAGDRKVNIIVAKESQKVIDVAVFDLQGRKIYGKEKNEILDGVTTFMLPLSTIPGVYLIKVGELPMQKIVVE